LDSPAHKLTAKLLADDAVQVHRLTLTELRQSTAALLLTDCAAGPVQIWAYKRHIATLSRYDPDKKHTRRLTIAQLRELDVFDFRGDTVCLTRWGKPLLTLEFYN
jgi:hypothetical protein